MSPAQPKIERGTFRVTFLPFGVSVDVAPGTSILDAARRADLPLRSTCGGAGTCGDCTVGVLSGAFTCKPSAALSEGLIGEGFALACLTEVEDDLTVHLPRFRQLSIKSVFDSRFFEEHRDELSGVYEVDPVVTMMDIRLPPPTLKENYSDFRRVERELEKRYHIENPDVEYSVLKNLARAVRENEGNVTSVFFKTNGSGTIIDIRPEGEGSSVYGVTCDLGTTTVSVQLVDLRDGTILHTASSYNQQIKCGEDIISRITYAQKPGRLGELHSLVIETVNQLIEEASREVGVPCSDIYYASVSGNTTMMHFLLDLEPRYIREEPYTPTLNRVPFIPSYELGLRMNREGRVHCAPAVGSYVGGDITAGLLCTPVMRDSGKISLFIDIGTNGELVVGNSNWLMGCACSAGPAFEGSGIKCGMPAADGAIERIRITDGGEIEYGVIGNGRPKGLCGSGLIDLLAELAVHGYIDRYGKFNEGKAGSRIVESVTGRGFLLIGGGDSYWGRDVVISENDIKNLIRTKAAVFSACSLLLKNVGLSRDSIDAVYIAGGFGQHLNIENAIRIGLFPDLDRSRFHYLGNSSLFGAYLILVSDRNMEIVNDISNRMTYLELNTEPGYMNEYTGALFLPHTHIDYFPSVRKLYEPGTSGSPT
jgi:uncharacterized 2Fe-2S/4Fe-4S cluster protein (DUF4445 family)